MYADLATDERHDLLRRLLSDHEDMCGCTPYHPCETRIAVVQWIHDIARTIKERDSDGTH